MPLWPTAYLLLPLRRVERENTMPKRIVRTEKGFEVIEELPGESPFCLFRADSREAAKAFLRKDNRRLRVRVISDGNGSLVAEGKPKNQKGWRQDVVPLHKWRVASYPSYAALRQAIFAWAKKKGHEVTNLRETLGEKERGER